MGQKELITAIIERSHSQNWELAKLEWDLIDVYESDEPETCLCGYFPIIELCVLLNRRTRIETIVGNVCVKKFMGIRSDKIFSAIKKIRKDNTKSLNGETLEFARERNWIAQKDFDFYVDIMKKRLLSEKQQVWKSDIHRKVLSGFKREKNK